MHNKTLLNKRISSAEGLHDAGLLPAGMSVLDIKNITDTYALGITPQVTSTIDTCRTDDPVAKQFVPSKYEMRTLPHEDFDPIGDNAYAPVKGIVHRYPDRVLLKSTSVCAVYCRYCFRREMVGKGDKPLTPAEMDKALSYIRSNRGIREVILTGGDPFVLSVRQLEPIFQNLQSIPHLDVIRVHTRVPVSDPKRINDDLLNLITNTDKAVYIALHVNHAQELNAAALECIKCQRGESDITICFIKGRK